MKYLTYFLLIIAVFYPSISLAWNDCPHGMVNDAYPGECGRYIDTDNDGICDHSQSPPEDRENTQISNNVEKNTYLSDQADQLKEPVNNIPTSDNPTSDNNTARKQIFTYFLLVIFWTIIIIAYVQYKKRK